MQKNILKSYQNITSGDMTTTLTSPSTNIQWQDNIGIQFNFTGTPTGNFFVDVSVDAVNWIPLTFSTSPVASGSAGSIYLDLNQLSSPNIRVRYVPTSGSGTLNSFITAKEV
jgi:hypothetical protein